MSLQKFLPGNCATILLLLLPAAAECAIELHKALVFVTPGLCQRQLRGVERALSIQHFEIVCRATLVSIDGEADGLLQISDRVLLAKSHLMELLITNQRIGNISKRMLNRLPVSDECLLMRRFSRSQIAFQRTTGENRLADLGAVRPDSELRSHQA